jgi:alpha-tubulin suppressor-like RCC1 family protein
LQVLPQTQIFAWGDNSTGKLGVDTRSEKIHTPMPVVGLKESVKSISCGADHTLCLTNSGRVY